MKSGDLVFFRSKKNNILCKEMCKDFKNRGNSLDIDYFFDRFGILVNINNTKYVLVVSRKCKYILFDELVKKYDCMVLSYIEDIDKKVLKDFIIDYSRCQGVDLLNKLPYSIVKLLFIFKIIDINNIYDYITGYLSKIFRRHNLNYFTKDGFENYREIFNINKFLTVYFYEK